MPRAQRVIAAFGFIAILYVSAGLAGGQTPIPVYHRFGPTVTDSMTVSTHAFESQLAAIHKGGYRVISLRDLMDSILKTSHDASPRLPPHSIAITADDGHQSIYTEMAPRMKAYGYPATLFIYPSAISNAKWAMTWTQLTELEKSGLCDIESHTFWHPNFHVEKRRLTPEAYKNFVDSQLHKPKEILEQRLKKRIDLLAWPFGIYDDWLMNEARLAGYRAGFTLDARPTGASDRPLAFPRYLMTDARQGSEFERFLAKATAMVVH